MQTTANIMLAKCEHAMSDETTRDGEAVPVAVAEKLNNFLPTVSGRNYWKLHADLYTAGEVAFLATRYGQHGDTHLVTLAYSLADNTARVTEYVF